MSQKKQKSVTVIGAGVGGLAVAALMAHRGWNVHVIERTSSPGGKAQRRAEGGFEFDEGPSILVLKAIYQELFQQLGEQLDNWICFERLNPAFQVYARGGGGFSIFSDFQETLSSLESYHSAARKEMSDFVSKLDLFAKGIGLSYADRPFFSLLDFANLPLVTSGLRIPPFEKYHSFINKHFSVPLLREFFYGFPGYAGYHPANAPASLALLPWSVLREGVFYPKGGVWAIVKALYNICCAKGVKFSFNSTVHNLEFNANGVSEIILEESQKAIKLSYGEHVIFGGCLGWLTEKFGKSFFSKKREQQFLKQSPSFFTIQAAVSTQLRDSLGLGHHNLLLPLLLDRSYQDYFAPGEEFPDTPPLYLNIPSVTDRTVAPPGLENLFVVVSVPSHILNSSGALPVTQGTVGFAEREKYQQRLGLYAEKCQQWIRQYFANFSWLDQPFRIKSTLNFEEQYLQKGGQIYGPSLQHAQQLLGLSRPALNSVGIRNFWLVGGSTQPGAGLPMVIQSAKILARHLND